MLWLKTRLSVNGRKAMASELLPMLQALTSDVIAKVAVFPLDRVINAASVCVDRSRALVGPLGKALLDFS
jgi:hypothetical protein